MAALRHATNRFHNLQRAENAGYRFFTDAKGIACVAMPHMGGMGVHFVEGALVSDPAERVRHPEALVYASTATACCDCPLSNTSCWRVPGTPTTPARRRSFGHQFQFTKAPIRYGLPDFYSLHAWVWFHNPAGQFAMWNPRVQC